MRAYKYFSFHIPTGKLFNKETLCGSDAEFLENLSRWNYMNPETWLFGPLTHG